MEDRRCQPRPLGLRQLILLAVLCTGAPLGLTGLGHVLADQDAARPLANLQGGQVTANSGNGVQVDGRNYPLHPSVIVQDDEGRRRQINEIVPGMFVKFHVKGEQIDLLIMLLAR